jgi:glucose dehydrogenase
MPRVYHLLTCVLTVCGAVLLVAFSADGGDRGHVQVSQGAWPSYGADHANSKYSPLDQITPSNVKDLRIT